MTPSIPPQLEEAYAACQMQAFGHYENFPVASLLLPKEIRPHVAALYAYARTADDFADEEKYEGMRQQEINKWEKGLKDAIRGKTAPPILMAFAHTLRTFNISTFLPFNLLKAYRMDIENHRWSTWNALLYYCRHSANPVGRMVLLISGIRDKKLHEYSDFICSGLQLINFWQDTMIDLKRGRIYYPLADLKKVGVKEKDLLAFKDSPQVRRMVENAVDITESYFQKGLPLLDAVSGRLKLELKATYLGGQGILNKIRDMDYNVLHQRPAFSKGQKMLLALKSLFVPFTP